MTEIASHYLQESVRLMRAQKSLADRAMAQLNEEELFVTLDSEANSVATIVKHMAGNMKSRFTDFLTTDGEKPDRQRDTEFEIAPETMRSDLMTWWEDGWERVFASFQALTPADVMRTVQIRGEPHTVMQAINRQVAHYAYHTGQIVFLAKHLRSKDWKTLSIARGQSENFKKALPESYERGLAK